MECYTNRRLRQFQEDASVRQGPLKVLQTREDLRQMRFRDLVQWIGSRGEAAEERNMKKDSALALAQKDMGCCGKQHHRHNKEAQIIVGQ